MNNLKKAGTALILASASACLSAGELPNTENMQGLQFNFSNPGARSLGIGGAFLGRADDATAAFANPAGLTTLFSPEISAEYRNTKYTTSYTESGSYPDGLESGSAKDSVNNLSYLSYVHPFEKFVLAVYRHELMNFKTDFSADSLDMNPGFSFPSNNSIDANIVSYGLSSAYRVNNRISIGASFVYYDYSQDAFTERFDDGLISTQLQTGDDSSWGVTLGAIFAITERLNFGLVYRSMPKFDTDYELFIGPNMDIDSDFTKSYQFEVPDVYGAGLSFQASENLTLNFDVVHVNYSDLSSPVFDAFAVGAPVAVGGKLGIDSGTELHFGAEYILPNKPVALRAGVWTDPAHTIEYKGSVDDSFDEKFNSALFQGSDDETHIAVGLGFFFGTKGQIDLAADFSDAQDVYSISGVFRFE